MRHHIADSGISVVYEPKGGSSVVDIVIVHGLQGHPFRTWTCKQPRRAVASPAFTQSAGSNGSRNGRRNLLRRAFQRRKDKSSATAGLEVGQHDVPAAHAGDRDDWSSTVFWPSDLLPQECPNARILVYGYDTKVTKYMTGATNKNSIFSHSKDLLYALSRVRGLDRPLILVAHSLGGIVVKEMLARSSTMAEDLLNNIVRSTAAVVFLGTPHRGSPELAAFGEWARSTVSAFGMETSTAILRALGLKTTDLERAQEAFSGLWRKYDFRVKTFQEGLGLSGVNLGVLGNKVVPDYSSLLGDEREHAETIQANHMDMCRFATAEDPNYRKIAGELRSIYQAIVELNTQISPQTRSSQRGILSLTAGSLAKVSALAAQAGSLQTERTCLQSLWFPGMHNHLLTLEKPAEQTSLWLFEHKSYLDWFHGRNQDRYNNLIWLKGKPGTGKSTLMKEAFRRAALEEDESGCCTANFFYNAKGHDLESSTLGVFRSLLHQLVPKMPEQLRRFCEFWKERNSQWLAQGTDNVFQWHDGELASFFEAMFMQPPPSSSKRRTLIFIDALDECDPDKMRHQAYFWRELTKRARRAGNHLGVCISSRHFPSVTLSDCPEIVVEDYNSDDIATYVEQRFRLTIAASEPKWELLRDKILAKSAGVFLWAALVVDEVLRGWDNGKGLRFLIKQVDSVPQLLEDLFFDMLSSVSSEKKGLTLRLFRWAVLAAKPLRLYEWHHVLAFIREPPPSSLQEWRGSDYFTETDDQLERQIRSISKGLVEVRSRMDEQAKGHHGHDVASACAGAGSFSLEHGETRVVQVIHESVREFFLRGQGFSVLEPNFHANFVSIGTGHLSIMATCIDYIEIKELDALIEARARADSHEQNPLESTKEKHSARSSRTGKSTRSSSLANFGTPHQIDMDISNREQPRQMPVLERLRSPDPDTFLETARWIDANLSATSSLLSLGVPNNTTSQFSATGRSQVLEDYPALLSYVTSELFHHVRLAEEQGVGLRCAMDRLRDGTTWARFLALREDLPLDACLSKYVADLGLSSWARYIRPRSNLLNLRGRYAEGDGLSNEPRDRGMIKSPAVPEEAPNAGSQDSQVHSGTHMASGGASMVISRPSPRYSHESSDAIKSRSPKAQGSRIEYSSTVLSCVPCRKRFLKCDKEHPICESKEVPLCRMKNRECRYPEKSSSMSGQGKTVRILTRISANGCQSTFQRNRDSSDGAVGNRPLRRGGSVASFSSASSHAVSGTWPVGSRRNSLGLDERHSEGPGDFGQSSEYAEPTRSFPTVIEGILRASLEQ